VSVSLRQEVEKNHAHSATSQILSGRVGRRWWWLLLLGPSWLLFAPLWIAWGLGQYHGDQTAKWEPFFHLPAPLVLCGGAAILAISRLARARRSLLLAILLLIWPLEHVLCVDNHWRQPVPNASWSENSKLRVLHWNMWHGEGGWEPILHTLEREQPDILILAEYGGRNGSETQTFLSKLSDRHRDWSGKRPQFHLTGSLLVCSRLRIDRAETVTLPLTEGLQVDLRTEDGTELRLLALDLPSSLRGHRDPLLRRVNDLIRSFQPDLVLGDFNAVRRATQLQRLPPGYRHAYDAAGSGWSYTWPVPVPVLAIDQCLIGPEIEAIEYVLGTGPSDHRWQRLDFRPQPNEARARDRVADPRRK
jgi:endonuclease/exonuclease/phosphatase (EEP) superfamily protein YafD